MCVYVTKNKDENAHRFALSSIGGEHLERERDRVKEREREREREREIVLGYYTYYP